MFEIIGLGAFAAAGLAMLVRWAKLKWKMKIVSNPGITDACVAGGMYFTHAGSFEGLMVSAVAAVFCSGMLSAARWFYGYIDYDLGTYVKGIQNHGNHPDIKAMVAVAMKAKTKRDAKALKASTP